MRMWWNWNTRWPQKSAPKGLGVQVPPCAPVLQGISQVVTASGFEPDIPGFESLIPFQFE